MADEPGEKTWSLRRVLSGLPDPFSDPPEKVVYLVIGRGQHRPLIDEPYGPPDCLICRGRYSYPFEFPVEVKKPFEEGHAIPRTGFDPEGWTRRSGYELRKMARSSKAAQSLFTTVYATMLAEGEEPDPPSEPEKAPEPNAEEQLKSIRAALERSRALGRDAQRGIDTLRQRG